MLEDRYVVESKEFKVDNIDELRIQDFINGDQTNIFILAGQKLLSDKKMSCAFSVMNNRIIAYNLTLKPVKLWKLKKDGLKIYSENRMNFKLVYDGV